MIYFSIIINAKFVYFSEKSKWKLTWFLDYASREVLKYFIIGFKMVYLFMD